MDEPIRYESTQEPLDDEERQLMDPGFWDWDNAVELPPVENPTAVLPIRLTYPELRAIGEAAQAQGLRTHAFIKQAALNAAHAERATVETSSTSSHAATA